MTTARFQVVETTHGYRVKDTTDGTLWTKTYTRLAWAINKAQLLNEAHGKRRY